MWRMRELGSYMGPCTRSASHRVRFVGAADAGSEFGLRLLERRAELRDIRAHNEHVLALVTSRPRTPAAAAMHATR
jgi:hypothetical protein